ncbi:hypothetical protein F5878DRAFT_663087 [Lentinula raphanica]|uniref:F-box domain-containing protein n=1 Tax=Lentinula raphanica TaxID=153919 RepID=A0AA38P4V6_9AGAR|nr:hypothetical protein F5878DRAFT_663087 [Lentinula raphanica]
MLRRSTRLRNKRDADNDDDNDDSWKSKRQRLSPSSQSLTLDVQLPESSKRQRMPDQFRGVRGKLGLLEKLAKDMPLDIILEIFCYVEPRDLLRLARTTRDLRAILMSKSSVNIWRVALGRVEGLPPCPADLNEPQYMNLLFEPFRHVCMSSGHCDNILWNLRARSCRTCLQTPLDNGHHLSIFNDLIPTDVFISATQELCNTILAYTAEYNALETQEACDEWITRRKTECCNVEKHKKECVKWYKTKLRNRADELNAIRKERKAAFSSNSFNDHILVRQAKKLTEYGWDSIRASLGTFLLQSQAQRKVRERKAVIASRMKSQYDATLPDKPDLREPAPTFKTVLCHQTFQNLVWGTPDSEVLTDEFLRTELLEQLPEIEMEWLAAIDQQLLKTVQMFCPSATVSDLHLAATVFVCRLDEPPFDRDNTWINIPFVFSDTYSNNAKEFLQACSLNPSTATFQDL